MPDHRRPPSSIGVLVFAFLVFGVLLLAQSATGDDDPDSVASNESPGSTNLPIDTTPGSSATTMADPADEWPAPDLTAPVDAPALPAVPMPSSSQFASMSLEFEPTVDLSNVTGVVWNNQFGVYYVITQDGVVHRVDRDLTRSEMVLDLRAETTELALGSERGLLGIAFDPRDGRMFLYFTDLGDDTNVISMAMVDGKPDPTSRREVLFIEQPGLGHKAGDLVFEPNGILYVAVGDGGGSQGRDAQDNSKLLGKILRIVPRPDGDGYDIPADNPFMGSSDVRPEIWATGLRNPWQIWRDPTTGDFYVGDVGESDIEELNFIPAGTSGLNFGWPWYQGSEPYRVDEMPAGVDLTGPIFEYPHSVGVAVITGIIYKGSAIPSLQGAFLFADMTGIMFGLGTDTAVRLDGLVPGVATTFVQGPDGELLVTSLEDGILRMLPG